MKGGGPSLHHNICVLIWQGHTEKGSCCDLLISIVQETVVFYLLKNIHNGYPDYELVRP
jgi:hypothetical protein